MPRKPRQAKGRPAHLSKKSRAMQRGNPAAAAPSAAAVAAPPEAVVSTPPVPKVPATAPAKAKAARYPYVRGELARIAILGLIIVVILVVLSLVIP